MLQFLAATRKTNTSFPKTCIIGTCLEMEGGKKKEISPISIATTTKSFWVLFFWKEWAMRRANVLRACLKDFIVGIESILVSNNPGTLVPTLWCDTWESSRFHLMDDLDLWEAPKTGWVQETSRWLLHGPYGKPKLSPYLKRPSRSPHLKTDTASK